MKLLIFIFIGLFITVSCIDTYNFEFRENTQNLVVEGRIFTIDSSYINLSYSDQKDGTVFYSPINDAIVNVIENGKTEIKYVYNSIGKTYINTNKAFRPRIGNSYSLKVKLINGKTYSTVPDTIKSIESIIKFSDSFNNGQSEFTIYGDLGKSQINKKHYLFTFVNYKKPYFCSKCDGKYSYDKDNNSACSSFFKNCNRNPLVVDSGFNEDYNFICGTSNCWNFLKLREYFIYSDLNLQIGTNRELKLLSIPLSSYERYFVEIHQNSISKSAYSYFNLLEVAAKNNGTLFDPTPPILYGNLVNENNRNDKALGYFLVANQQIYSYNLDRSKVNMPITNSNNNEKEFIVKYDLKLAPPLLGCGTAPLSDKCIQTDNLTPWEPYGWVYY